MKVLHVMISKDYEKTFLPWDPRFMQVFIQSQANEKKTKNNTINVNLIYFRHSCLHLYYLNLFFF